MNKLQHRNRRAINQACFLAGKVFIRRQRIVQAAAILFTLAALVAVFSAVWFATGLPIVEVSNSTGKCNRVLLAQGYDCDNLPSRFEQVWVR